MANMGSYCKAYPIERYREFSGWSEKSPITATPDQEDCRYLFLQENLVVTDGIFIDEKVVFDQVTPEWESYCKEKLGFEVPDFSQPTAQTTEHEPETTMATGGVQ